MDEVVDKIRNGYSFSTDEVFSESVRLIRRNLTPILFYTSIYLLLNVLLIRLGYRGMIVQALIAGPFIAGYYNAFLADHAGYQIQISHFFTVFQNPLRFIGGHLFASIITAAGIYALVLPGIYFAVSYLLVMPFLVNRNLSLWLSLEASRRLILANWLKFFWMLLLLAFINLVGALLFGVGLLVTIPFTYATFHTVFHKIMSDSHEETSYDWTNENMFR